MVTLNDALIELVEQKLVEPKEAYLKAAEKSAFAAALKAKRFDTSFLGGLLSPTRRPTPRLQSWRSAPPRTIPARRLAVAGLRGAAAWPRCLRRSSPASHVSSRSPSINADGLGRPARPRPRSHRRHRCGAARPRWRRAARPRRPAAATPRRRTSRLPRGHRRRRGLVPRPAGHRRGAAAAGAPGRAVAGRPHRRCDGRAGDGWPERPVASRSSSITGTWGTSAGATPPPSPGSPPSRRASGARRPHGARRSRMAVHGWKCGPPPAIGPARRRADSRRRGLGRGGAHRGGAARGGVGAGLPARRGGAGLPGRRPGASPAIVGRRRPRDIRVRGGGARVGRRGAGERMDRRRPERPVPPPGSARSCRCRCGGWNRSSAC